VVASSHWKTWKYSTALLFYTQSGRVIRASVRPGGGSAQLLYRATGLVSALGTVDELVVRTTAVFTVSLRLHELRKLLQIAVSE